MVRGTVKETLNAMLDAEADQLCGAARYERSEARQDTRLAVTSGRSDRRRRGQSQGSEAAAPDLQRLAIIERYRRRESSVEEALIEMYLAGISVRRVEDVTEALWGTRVSPSTVSNLDRNLRQGRAWRNRRMKGDIRPFYLDEIVMKRAWAGEVHNVSLLVASAVNSHVPTTKVREVSHMLKGDLPHCPGEPGRGQPKARAIVDDLRATKMNTAADLVERSVSETLTYYAFPDIHWREIRTVIRCDR